MKVKALVGVPRWEAALPARRHHRPVLIARRWGGARAYTLGPERRWAMREQDEVRGNSDGSP